MKNIIKNKQGGFIIKLIIFVVAIFLLMRYFDITFSEVNEWVKSFSVSKVVDWAKGLWNSVP